MHIFILCNNVSQINVNNKETNKKQVYDLNILLTKKIKKMFKKLIGISSSHFANGNQYMS